MKRQLLGVFVCVLFSSAAAAQDYDLCLRLHDQLDALPMARSTARQSDGETEDQKRRLSRIERDMDRYGCYSGYLDIETEDFCRELEQAQARTQDSIRYLDERRAYDDQDSDPYVRQQILAELKYNGCDGLNNPNDEAREALPQSASRDAETEELAPGYGMSEDTPIERIELPPATKQPEKITKKAVTSPKADPQPPAQKPTSSSQPAKHETASATTPPVQTQPPSAPPIERPYDPTKKIRQVGPKFILNDERKESTKS